MVLASGTKPDLTEGTEVIASPGLIDSVKKGRRDIADLTNAQLDAMVAWAISNDPELSSELDDEVDFRLARNAGEV